MIEHLIGDQEESQDLVSETLFGWQPISHLLNDSSDEEKVGWTLFSHGIKLEIAGKRNQSYDIKIINNNNKKLIKNGLYEVKKLWKSDKATKFDRRFKVGTRGEKIYGRRDAEIKAFCLALENAMDTLDLSVAQVDFFHKTIDSGISRKHSKSFSEDLELCWQILEHKKVLLDHVEVIKNNQITISDIQRGFDNIDGIFVIAGPMYTLITKAEFPKFLEFDSASVEGPKLRLAKSLVIKSEQVNKKTNKGKKGK